MKGIETINIRYAYRLFINYRPFFFDPADLCFLYYMPITGSSFNNCAIQISNLSKPSCTICCITLCTRVKSLMFSENAENSLNSRENLGLDRDGILLFRHRILLIPILKPEHDVIRLSAEKSTRRDVSRCGGRIYKDNDRWAVPRETSVTVIIIIIIINIYMPSTKVPEHAVIVG